MMQGLFAVLSSICHICCISNSTKIPFISLKRQRIMISYSINHIFVDEKMYKMSGRKFEK